MKRLASLLVMLICAVATAQDLPRIAVYVTGDASGNEKEALGTIMLASLVNSGRYLGIERSESFLAKLDEEHVRQRSGAIDDNQISELGRQFGVRYICIAAITPALGAFNVSARIIDVETAAVAFIGEANSTLKTIDELTRVSDEVVAVMFGKAPARPRFEAERKRIGISVGAGGLFSNDFGGGMDRKAAMPYHVVGTYLFIDAGYAYVAASYAAGSGIYETPAGQADANITRSTFAVGIYAKYPELSIGADGKIKLFPLLGGDYEMCLSAKFTDQGGNPFTLGAPKNANELNALWGRLGAGADFNFKESVYLRAELMYGVRTSNAYEKEWMDETARLGHGLTAKVGAGIKF